MSDRYGGFGAVLRSAVGFDPFFVASMVISGWPRRSAGWFWPGNRRHLASAGCVIVRLRDKRYEMNHANLRTGAGALSAGHIRQA